MSHPGSTGRNETSPCKLIMIISFFCCCAHLGDADPVDPLMQSPDVIAAQVLDVLRLLLDLWMLRIKVTDFYCIFLLEENNTNTDHFFIEV